MAVVNFRNASVVYNAVDISVKVRNIRLNLSAEDLDGTAMGATSRTHVPGLRDDRIELTVFQDYAVGVLDSVFAAQLGVAAGVACVIKPDSGAVTTSNPSYTLTNAVLLDYSAMDGEVGTLQLITIVLVPAAGSPGIVRATV